jgi:hypothetical protein
VFNPYDRALFLSMRDHRRFLSWDNFRTPYQGLMQSIAIRAISGGLWFPLEHFFRDWLSGAWRGVACCVACCVAWRGVAWRGVAWRGVHVCVRGVRGVVQCGAAWQSVAFALSVHVSCAAGVYMNACVGAVRATVRNCVLCFVLFVWPPGGWTVLAGSAAGILSSAILNPLTAIKYQTW